MKLLKISVFSVLVFLMHSCIQDDFVDDNVDPVIRITSTIDSLEINTTFQLEYVYLNNIGQKEDVSVQWVSTNPESITIDDNGLIRSIASGSSEIIVTVDVEGKSIEDILQVAVSNTATVVSDVASKEGEINTTSSYALSGEFIFTETDTGVSLEFLDGYNASTALPGLYIYLSNNKNSIANAHNIGRVEVFNGAHIYDIPNVGFNDYSYIVYFCKPFNVKVGDGEL